MRRSCVVFVWLLGGGLAAAQPPAPAGFVSAGAVEAWLLRADVPGQSNPSIPTTGIGGHAAGLELAIDVSLSRRIGVDAEFTTTGHFTDYQEATKYHTRVRHRDALLTGLLRIRLRPDARAGIDLVGGAGVAFADTQLSTSYLVWTPQQGYGPFSDYQPWPYGGRRPAITAGVDVPIGRGRVSIVPSFRLHYVFRDEDTSNQLGLGRWSIRPGLSARISF